MKLQIKRGLPGSGKTTEAYNTVHEQGNIGRINRDDLRAMLFESKWTGPREKVIIACEKAIARVLFEHDMNAIIDDTNLSAGHCDMWKQAGKDIGFNEIRVDKLVADIPKSVAGDLGRQKYVGKAIIHRMALLNSLIDFGDKPIVLVDIDGTLADGDHRYHYLEESPKNWQRYFDACGRDKPVDIVVRWVRELSKTHTICLVSGRPDSVQKHTMQWLADNNVPYEYLFMRSASDRKPDTEVKKQILDKLPKDKISFAIDDRPSVCRMWKENGITVYPVRGAIDEF